MLEVINSQVWSSSTGHMLRDSFYQFLQNLEAIKYNKCQDAPLGGHRGTQHSRESDGRQVTKSWDPDKYFTFLLHNEIFQNTFYTEKANQSKSVLTGWGDTLCLCARYNRFWVRPACIVRVRPARFPRLETKQDPSSCESQPLKHANDEKGREVK